MKKKLPQTPQTARRRSRGDKRAAAEQEKILAQIAQLLDTYSDKEIITKLNNMSETTFYRYKDILRRDLIMQWQQIVNETMEEQAMRFYHGVMKALKEYHRIIDSDKEKTSDKLTACEKLTELSYELFDMMGDAPKKLSTEASELAVKLE